MTAQTTYIVVMDRVGRNRHVAPFAVLTSTDPAFASADIAAALHQVARKHCGSTEIMTGADVTPGQVFVSVGGRDAGTGRIHRADICFCRDEICPKCGYAETYAAGQSLAGAFPTPFAIGCRKCGWVELLPEVTP